MIVMNNEIIPHSCRNITSIPIISPNKRVFLIRQFDSTIFKSCDKFFPQAPENEEGKIVAGRESRRVLVPMFKKGPDRTIVKVRKA